MRLSAVLLPLSLLALAPPAIAQQGTMERVTVQVSTPAAGGAKVVPAVVQKEPAAAEKGAARTPTAKEGRTLRLLSDFGSPPFSFRDGMERKGFEVDLGEAIGREMGAKVEWVQKNFSIASYASALDSGAADAAIASITITDDRKRRLAFTRPYFRTSLAAAVQNDIDWRTNDFRRGLKNWLVGVVRGTTSETWARNHLASEVKTYSTPKRLCQALKDMTPRKLAQYLKKPDASVAMLLSGVRKMKDLNGKTGFCIILDQPVLTWTLSKYHYRFEIVERGFDHQYYGIAVSKRKPELLSELNAALEALDKKGIYGKIYEKWYAKAEKLPLFEKKEAP